MRYVKTLSEATCLREAASAEAGNAAGGLFQHPAKSHSRTSVAMPGTLYIVSTPIGNLEDLTFRALRVLQEVSVIAAEDTRRTQKLCSHYGISTPLTSYHDYNKEEKTEVLLARMEQGASIALVSDAGTPLISDPGYYLVTSAIARGLPIIAIPGPSAILAALTISGLPTDAFVFQGFFPKKPGQQDRLLDMIEQDARTTIVFESPQRLLKTLGKLQERLGDRRMAVARELTKTFEECVRGTPREIIQAFAKKTVKGELTLVIEGKPKRRTSRAHE